MFLCEAVVGRRCGGWEEVGISQKIIVQPRLVWSRAAGVRYQPSFVNRLCKHAPTSTIAGVPPE
jgi:hypothetical protein